MRTRIFLLVLTACWLTSLHSHAQEICGTPVPAVPPVFSKAKQDSINTVAAINLPYNIPVFITIFANNDGSNAAVTRERALIQFENMVAQFSGTNICFSLINILQVNNSDLNSHNASTEEAELNPFRIENCLNIFIHNSLSSSNGGLNGTAYAIPNTYLSLSAGTINSTTNLTTMAHETGHCLGLLHTFEDFYGVENVTRNPASGCYDCDVDGDLICDTPADDPTDPNGNVNAACVYTAGRTDGCGVTYNPATNNIMGYGNRACRTIFTAGQGARMRSQLIGSSTINGLIAQDNLYRPSSANSSILYTNGNRVIVARDNLYISNYSNNAFSATGSATVYLQAKRVRLKPGTTLAPTSGRINVKSNTYCN